MFLFEWMFLFFTYYTGNSDSKDRRGEPLTLCLLSFLQCTVFIVFPLLVVCGNLVHLWLHVYFPLSLFHINLIGKSNRNKYSLCVKMWIMDFTAVMYFNK